VTGALGEKLAAYTSADVVAGGAWYPGREAGGLAGRYAVREKRRNGPASEMVAAEAKIRAAVKTRNSIK
jgi:hypothetical protein